MFTEDSVITAAIRAGVIQQIQAEPVRRTSTVVASVAPRVAAAARVGGAGTRR